MIKSKFKQARDLCVGDVVWQEFPGVWREVVRVESDLGAVHPRMYVQYAYDEGNTVTRVNTKDSFPANAEVEVRMP